MLVVLFYLSLLELLGINLNLNQSLYNWRSNKKEIAKK